MRKLTKHTPSPAVTTKLNGFQSQLNAIAATAPIPSTLKGAYNFKELREAVTKETAGKCAYCEDTLLATVSGDIEHILPKAHFRQHMFDYQNLTLACPKCNNSKSQFYDPSYGLINPFTTDPEKHLVAAGPLVMALTDLGETTKEVLDLNRPALITERIERIESIKGMVMIWRKLKPGPRKDLLTKQILAEAEKDKKFSLTVKCLLELLNIPGA